MNGLESEVVTKSDDEAGKHFAITSGTEPYKRLSLVYKQFCAIKNNMGLEKLIIAGNPKLIDPGIANKSDVFIVGLVPREEYLRFLQASQVYISASEVENSSNAIIEAIQFGLPCILSKIPSHLEMFNTGNWSCENAAIFEDFVLVDESMLKNDLLRTWESIIDVMCDEMELF